MTDPERLDLTLVSEWLCKAQYRVLRLFNRPLLRAGLDLREEEDGHITVDRRAFYTYFLGTTPPQDWDPKEQDS